MKQVLMRFANDTWRKKLLSVAFIKLGLPQKANPNQYYGETAKDYISKRVKQKRWHKEQNIMQNLLLEVPYGSSVIDVPFGTGMFVNYYLEKGMSVFGLDISKEMLFEAQKYLGKSFFLCNVSIGNAACLPYKYESFDIVVCCRFFDLIPLDMARKVLFELKRVAKSRIILHMKVRKKTVNFAGIIERLLDIQKNDKKLGEIIYEEDLNKMFNEFDLEPVKKEKIVETSNHIYFFYVLKKRQAKSI